MQDNLPELRDIHLPEGVSMFPLAYGWWVVLLGIIGVFLLIKAILYMRRKSKKRYARKLIETISESSNPVLAAKQLSEILRRICVLKYPTAATLYGQEWLNFLHLHCRQQLNEAEAGLLLNAPYMSLDAKGYGAQEIKAIKQFCISWIGENL